MIYFVQSLEGGPVKIGFTDNLEQRLAGLEAKYQQPLAVLATMDGGRREESELHDRFAHLRLGRTEQFRPTADLMAFIGRPLLVAADPSVVEAMPCHLKPLVVQLRGSSEFKAWVESGADFDRSTVAVLVEKALVSYLKGTGFAPKPPRR